MRPIVTCSAPMDTPVVKPLKPFKLERFFDKYEFNTPYLMCPSDCEPLKLQEVLNMADTDTLEMWNNLSLHYTNSKGSEQLRQAISEMYGKCVDPDREVLVMAPQEGIYLSMLASLRQGDVVVVTYPGYQSLHEIARSLGCELRFWRPQILQSPRFKFDIQDVEPLLKGAKMLVVNFPHNPTGATLSREEFSRLIDLCKEGNVVIFSDEMYRGLEHGRRESQLPSAVELCENSVALSGVSKTMSLPGLRIGWLLSRNTKIVQRIKELKDYTTICSSAPSEVLSTIAIKNNNNIIQSNVDIITRNKDLLRKFCSDWPEIFQFFESDAGSIVFPRFQTENEGAVLEVLRMAREEAGVLLLPGSLMLDEETNHDEQDETFKMHFRVGLGRRDFEKCLQFFNTFIGNNKLRIEQLLHQQS